jgi:hypothetical protein
MTWKHILSAAALACCLSAAHAGAPELNAGAAASLLDPSSTAALAGDLRTVLIDAMPDPLVKDDSHWGGQRMVIDGLTWRERGLRVKAEVRKVPRNAGLWWKVKVSGVHLPETLVVDLREVRQVEPGKTTFTAFVSFDARVEYDQQNWERGVRLYSGSADARMRLNLAVRCEATTKLEPNGTLLPDAVFRLRVTEAKLGYDHFEVDHVGGVGGDLAKVIGDAAREGVERWHPSLERNLLQKADAAIVKAGDTKEVRLSVLKLLKSE